MNRIEQQKYLSIDQVMQKHKKWFDITKLRDKIPLIFTKQFFNE
jgi:hypothetical protein